MQTYLERFWHLSCDMPIIRLSLAFVYLVLFFFTIEMLLKRPHARNAFTAFLGCMFFTLCGIFLIPFLKPSLTHVLALPWVGVFMATLPALLFIYFRTAFSGAEESIASLAHFNHLKDEFLSVASHELRTPLSVINGFAEILVRERLGPLNDEQKRRVRKILMQAQRLNRIVDELLDLSRIRSGKVQIRNEVFDLVPVLKACMDDHAVVCEQHEIKLIDEIQDQLPDVIGDIERVTQIVVNLLNNAIKYTEPGGTVTLAASYRKAKNEIYIEIRDTGIGIDVKDQEKVFDEFFRCNHQYARRYSGSGLGLAIVKQLVEVHGGFVGVSSEGLGKGTTFYFTLRPAQKNAKETPPVARQESLLARPLANPAKTSQAA